MEPSTDTPNWHGLSDDVPLAVVRRVEEAFARKKLWLKIVRTTMRPVLDLRLHSERFEMLMTVLPSFAKQMRQRESASGAPLARIVDLGRNYLQAIAEQFSEETALLVRNAIADRRRAIAVWEALAEHEQDDAAWQHPEIEGWWAASTASAWGLNVLSAAMTGELELVGDQRQFVETMIHAGAADGYHIIRTIQRSLSPDDAEGVEVDLDS